MRLNHYKPSKKAIFWMLLGLSAVSLILPPRATDGARHGTQLLVPLQDVVYFLTYQGARSIRRVSEPERELREYILALENQVASQAGQIQQLEAENDELTSLRTKRFPDALHANVVGRDIVEWRDSLLVERGANSSVSPQDWVASRFFVNRGTENRVDAGCAVISREILLGRVEQVSPFMSRVCLFTDVGSAPLRVQVGGFEADRFVAVDYPCSVSGRGHSEMVIRNVDYRFVDRDAGPPEMSDDVEAPIRPDRSRGIRVGDLVYSAPGQLGLPVPMIVGRVKEIVEDPSRRLVADVVVEPPIKVDDIRTVSIIPLIRMDVAMD